MPNPAKDPAYWSSSDSDDLFGYYGYDGEEEDDESDHLPSQQTFDIRRFWVGNKKTSEEEAESSTKKISEEEENRRNDEDEETSDEEDEDRDSGQKKTRFNPYDVDDHETNDKPSKASSQFHEIHNSIHHDFMDLVHEVEQEKRNKRQWTPGPQNPSSKQTDEVRIILDFFSLFISFYFQGVVHPKQKIVADCLVKKIKKSQPNIWRGKKYFDFFTIVPSFKSLGDANDNLC